MADSIERIADDMDEAAEAYAGHHSSGTFRRLAARLRALSPAGGDWLMVPRDRLEAISNMLGNARLTTSSGLPSTAAEEIDVQHAAASELRELLAASPQQEPGADEAKSVAERLIAWMIDISESVEDGDFTEEGHRKCVQLAHDAIRQNEWFFGGRPKPTPADESGADVARSDELMAMLGAGDLTAKEQLELHEILGTPSGQTLSGAGGDDGEQDAAVWMLIALAEKCGAKKDEDDTNTWWTLDLNALYALEANLYARNVPWQYTATSAGTAGDDSEDAARDVTNPEIDRSMYAVGFTGKPGTGRFG